MRGGGQSDQARLAAMFDHIGLEVADVQASLDFYVTAFAPVGMREVLRIPTGDTFVVALAGSDGAPNFWLHQGHGTETRELHIAFRAADRDAVDAVHRAAVDAGAQVLHAPREWPEYHPGYYGVFLRDLDGHNVEAVYRGGPGADERGDAG
jgi:catechol 2,3-dioxygenase-like lactoylglutathione lyase family enzyme